MMSARKLKNRFDFNAELNKHGEDRRFYEQTMPEVYVKNGVVRQCLRCDKRFVAAHKFIRMCDTCKAGWKDNSNGLHIHDFGGRA
jgi:hypothetical protein